jgi:hypothetical protein
MFFLLCSLRVLHTREFLVVRSKNNHYLFYQQATWNISFYTMLKVAKSLMNLVLKKLVDHVQCSHMHVQIFRHDQGNVS